MKWKIKANPFRDPSLTSSDLQEGTVIRLLTPEEWNDLPDGTIVHDIFGREFTKNPDHKDFDTRGGFMAYGVQE